MKAEAIYWRGSVDTSHNLTNALVKVGFQFEEVRSLESLLDATARKLPILIVVDATAGDREASQRVVELSSTPNLFEVPILFLGKGASKRADSLTNQFSKLLPVDVPFDLGEVVRALMDLVEVSIDEAALQKAIGDEEPEAASAREDGSAVFISADEVASEADRTATLRTGLEVELDPSKLVASYGGHFFALASDAAMFDDRFLIPRSHPKAEAVGAMLKELSEKSPWVAVHSRRVAYASSSVANLLAFGPSRDANIRTVSLMLNWGLIGELGGLDNLGHVLTLDILLDSSPQRLEDLARGFDRSAVLIKDKLQDDMAYRTMTAIVGIIRNSPVREHSAVIEDAQCAMISELTDRGCWIDGHWNSYGAHRVLRHLRGPSHLAFDEQVASAFIRVLGEAVCSHFNLHWRQGKVDPETLERIAEVRQQAQDEAEKLFGFEGHVDVPIYDLLPGMRLARPILSKNGEVLLKANVELDNDIIGRLWQLAALAPLEQAVVVASSVTIEELSRAEKPV